MVGGRGVVAGAACRRRSGEKTLARVFLGGHFRGDTGAVGACVGWAFGWGLALGSRGYLLMGYRSHGLLLVFSVRWLDGGLGVDVRYRLRCVGVDFAAEWIWV